VPDTLGPGLRVPYTSGPARSTRYRRGVRCYRVTMGRTPYNPLVNPAPSFTSRDTHRTYFPPRPANTLAHPDEFPMNPPRRTIKKIAEAPKGLSRLAPEVARV
jgi:hypothetical protein